MAADRPLQEILRSAMQKHQQGLLDAAERDYRHVLSISPDNADALHLRGVLARQKGDSAAAVELIRKAIAIHPTSAAFYNNLGNALTDLKRWSDAAEAFRQAAQWRPQSAEIHHRLARTLVQLEQFGDALRSYETASGLNPGDLAVHWETANLHQGRSNHAAAESSYRKAISVATLPANAVEIRINLGHNLASQRKLADAERVLREAIAICESAKLDAAPAWINLGNVLRDQGRLDASVDAFRRAVDLAPAEARMWSSYLQTIHYDPSFSPQRVAAEHRRWEIACADPLKSTWRPHINSRDPDRRLRVGYVSGDFRDHPVARALLPMLVEHDHANFEIVAYHDAAGEDDLTHQIRSCADQWRTTRNFSDEQLADQIRADAIDLLVDVSVHTAGNRLLAFARKPAPVQLSYGGSPVSAGLSAIDYRITDPYLEPPDAPPTVIGPDAPLRLRHCFWSFPKDAPTPDVGPLPCLTNKYITFGSLNNPLKHTPQTIALFARILHSVPNSRLLLMVREHDGISPYLLEQFALHNIDPSRIEMAGVRPRHDYLALYNRIDIGLDPLACSGHATSCDSFWMGVSVVTLPGPTSFSRGGASLLSNLNLHDLIANSEDNYLAIATALASDQDRLVELRRTLRDRMRSSPICDGRSLAHNIEQLYRDAWRCWCESR